MGVALPPSTPACDPDAVEVTHAERVHVGDGRVSAAEHLVLDVGREARLALDADAVTDSSR